MISKSIWHNEARWLAVEAWERADIPESYLHHEDALRDIRLLSAYVLRLLAEKNDR